MIFQRFIAAHLRPLILISGLLVLSGCAHQGGPLPDQNWQERYDELADIQHWQLTGKLGIRIPGDNGSARMNWQQRFQEYDIDLSGPMGSNRFSIKGRDGEVTLLQAGFEPQVASSAEELILANTGWTIPVAQLAWWVRALPAPDEPVSRLQRDEQRQLVELEQAGWIIQYSNYRAVTRPDQNGAVALPGRVIASWGDIRLTLVIRDWQLGERN